jgi:hypothetical protein
VRHPRPLPIVLAAALALPAASPAAQGAAAAPAPAAAATIPTPAQQVAAAVLPLPEEFRADATVLGWDAGGRLTTLRAGGGAFVCLASDPRMERFHVACYHRSLEPFMARGRALRAAGVTGDAVDSVRFREVREGKLAMPSGPAALYSLTGPAGSWNPATNAVTGARPLFVIYIAGATAESTGLSARPRPGTPWIMFPGTPKAHIMFVPTM